tara:strand:- start:91 stop:687 length:597 start_codon:yes stop_codon:yes gene_type:complete
MKKTLFTSFLILFTVVSISQNKIGVLAGANSSTISDGFFKKVYESGFSYHLGLVYDLELSNKISFRPKMIFSQQGDRIKTDKNYYNGNLTNLSIKVIDYKLTYLNIPLNFKFFNKTYLLAGPQIGFLLSTKKMDLDFGDINKKIDFGLNIGVGRKINDFFVEFNLYQGMSKILKYEVGSINFDATNSVAQLSIGYYIK